MLLSVNKSIRKRRWGRRLTLTIIHKHNKHIAAHNFYYPSKLVIVHQLSMTYCHVYDKKSSTYFIFLFVTRYNHSNGVQVTFILYKMIASSRSLKSLECSYTLYCMIGKISISVYRSIATRLRTLT
jgi:hypothetical protein